MSTATRQSEMSQADREMRLRQIDSHIEILLNPSSNNMLLSEATIELKKLSSGDPISKGRIAKGSAAILIKLLDTSEVDLATNVAKLLRSVSVENESAAELVRQDGVRRLIHVLNTTNEKRIHLPVAATIWNISADDTWAVSVHAEGGVQALVPLLACDDENVKHEATGAIRNLSFHEETRPTIIATGGLDFLVQNFLRSNAPNLQKNTATVLKNIASDSMQYRELVGRRLGVVPLLAKLRDFDLLDLWEEDIAPRPSNEYGNINLSKLPAVGMLLDRTGRGGMGGTDDVLTRAEDTIRWEDVKLKKKIGEGAYGDVHKGIYNGFAVAVKVMKRETRDRDTDKALEELRLMRALKHPNVVLLMGACLNPSKKLVIVTEFCHRGNLKDCLKATGGQQLSLLKRIKLVKDIIAGLNWIHSCGIVHRDLKLCNFLVTEDWNVKLSDFGLSLRYKDVRTGRFLQINHFGGNVKYSPPEILKARAEKRHKTFPYNEKTDVYSFALMLWEIIALNKRLFPEDVKGSEKITQWVCAGKRPEIDMRWPLSLRDLLQACWHFEQESRPRFQEISIAFSQCVTDVICSDELGKHICAKLWRGSEMANVPYSEFERVFAEKTKLDYNTVKKVHMRALAALVSDQFDGTVPIERFCNVLQWFGPLAPVNEFLKNLVDVLHQEWFYGFIVASRAAHIVGNRWQSAMGKKKSYFLIRFAAGEPVGHFALTYITPAGDICQRRIRHSPGSDFVLEKEGPNDTMPELRGATLPELVKLLAKSPLQLKKSCPGSPFQALFQISERGTSGPVSTTYDTTEVKF